MPPRCRAHGSDQGPARDLARIGRAVKKGIPDSGPRYAGTAAQAKIWQCQERSSADTARQYLAAVGPRAAGRAERTGRFPAFENARTMLLTTQLTKPR